MGLKSAEVGDTPEEKLLFYLLVDSVERWKEGRREAYRWLFLSESNDCFSFRWVCNCLRVDADGLRKQLTERKQDISFFGRSVSRLCRTI